eukprot:TRINITY_DN404_c4_g1_i1.p1 TRINITY_DN404_c4_g1~~TRINITY_DN404_c4_g1_i1.p1  ORF type:complete len:538 (+),score=174.16 TRINITY_DN404_c4_g1_i1:40-1614(+)
MSYETCRDLYPSTPCPAEYEGQSLINWTAVTPYPATCTYNGSQVFGVVMGMVSIVCWILVACPQLWVNYKLKKADGLSIYFILQWFAADTCNLVGAVVTKQVSSQIYLAIWYVIQDTMMFTQYLYYRHINKDNDVANLDDANPDERTKLVPDSPIARPSRDFLERQETGTATGSGGGMSTTGSDTSNPHSHSRNIVYVDPKTGEECLSRNTPHTPQDVMSLGQVRRCQEGGASDIVEHREGTISMATRRMSTSSLPAEGSHGSRGSVTLRGVLMLFGIGSMMLTGTGMTSHAGFEPAQQDAAPRAGGMMRRLLQMDEYGIDHPPSSHPKKHATDAQVNLYNIGIAMGWLSAVLYLGSRVPQLWKNMKRKSTDGLSPLMFTMAVGGNITYFFSFYLITPTESGMMCHLPWVVGSLGTIFFDILALLQFLYYRKRSNELLEEAVDDEEKGAASTQAPSIRLPGTSRASVARARRHSYSGYRPPIATPKTGASGDEVQIYPLALPPSVYAGSIRNGYYGRIGIWYNE